MDGSISLATAFAARHNAFNAVRLLLASTVVVWHSWLFPGRSGLAEPVAHLLQQVPVDGFFVLSGFLITRSWLTHPETRRFLIARFLRLYPALWVCVSLTAFVIIPAAGAVAGDPGTGWRDKAHYVLGNATSFGWFDHLYFGTATEGFARRAFNLSLWSLHWEIACYLLVLTLGLLGLLRARVVLGLALTAWMFAAALTSIGVSSDIVLGPWPAPRLAMMFLLGSAGFLLADRIPLRRDLALLSVAAVLIASLIPDYRLVGAPFLAYLVLWLGLALGGTRLSHMRHDLSYGIYIYGAPVQQALLILGVELGWAPFALLTLALVVPLAALSWLLIERPAIRLRARLDPGSFLGSRATS